jgi:hypothetical protein
MYTKTNKRLNRPGNFSGLDESFYAKKKRAILVEEGAISYEEDGFMRGYEDGLEEIKEEDDFSWIHETEPKEIL